MCGIVGYTGRAEAAGILLEGLSKLEYRGYDSAGIAVESEDQEIHVVKAKGKLEELKKMTDNGAAVPGHTGIGHTRWATHGEPSIINAHPHLSTDGEVAIVHNGIIENYQELKARLQKDGYSFVSETDTEVAAQLISYYYKKSHDPLKAISHTMIRITGSYALAIMFRDIPGVIFAAKKDGPLVIGLGKDGGYLASDVPAILKYTRSVYYLENLEIARVEPESVRFFNIEGEEIQKEISTIDWDAEAAEKGGFEHFMLKEIHEQPKAVRDTISPRIKNGRIVLDELGLSEDQIRNISRIYYVACGSAYHTAVVAKYVMEKIARIPAEAEIASEFRYRDLILDPKGLVVVVSQSGETADTREAMREAKKHGLPVVAIVNVVGSSIAREADNVLYTWAGPEISVATTKAYSAQLAVHDLMAVEFGRIRGTIGKEQYEHYVEELQKIPDKIEEILKDKERIQWFASKYSGAQDIYFIGRGIDYGVSLEGSLKLKEISYIHSEAYAAGELKHGAIALIEKGTLCVSILTQPDLMGKMISNMVEVRSRGGYIFGLTTYGHYPVEDSSDFTVYVPNTDPCFTPSLSIIPLQLFAYYVSCAKGLDVDKPRNLAKSVTVE